jgi:hypothetical protein
MAGETMSLISTVTVGAGGAADITFSNIPQTYSDLLIIYSIRTAYVANSAGLGIIPNGTEYPNLERGLYGSGSSIVSTTGAYRTIGVIPGANYTANTFGNGSIYVANYAIAGTSKTFSGDSVTENGSTAANEAILTVRSANTNAISSLSIADSTSGANLIQNSTASLYGILQGSGGATVS